jgi:tape measure domain-containing protein
MAEAGNPTGTVQIGLDATQFRAGTQAILSDIRSIMQGLTQFEKASNKTGGSLRGFEDASRSLKSFRAAIDGDALPALRRLQNQASASANSLSRVFQVGAQSAQAVGGINRVTSALAAQERQALRTADAMARAATASQRGAMAFRNGGRSSSGTSGRSVSGGTRGARSSLDDSGAAARRLSQKADALFARVGKLTTGKAARPIMPFQSNPDVRYARRGSLAPKISAETRSLLRKADQLRASRAQKNYSGYTDEPIRGTASLEDAAGLFARALARSAAAGVRIRGASPQSARGRKVALQGDTALDEMMSAIRSGKRSQRPMAFRMSRNQRRLQLVEAALAEQLDSAGLGRRMPRSEIPLLRGGWVADAPSPYRRSSIPRLRKMRRITVGAYSAGQSMDPKETGYLGALSGVGAPGVGAAMLAHEIKRRGRAGKSLPLKAVSDALPLYLRGAFRRGPSGKVRMSTAAAERTQTLGNLTSLAMSGADAKKLTKLIRARLRAEEEALGLPAGSVKFAKKGMLGGLGELQKKTAEKRTRTYQRGYSSFSPSPGTSSVRDASERMSRSLIRSAAAGVTTKEYGGRIGQKMVDGPDGLSNAAMRELRQYQDWIHSLRQYAGNGLPLPRERTDARGGVRNTYRYRKIAGFDPRSEDNRLGLSMARNALDMISSGDRPGRVALAPNPYYNKKGFPRQLTRLKMVPVGAYASSMESGSHGYLGALAGSGENWAGRGAPLGGVGGTLIAGELRRRDRFRRAQGPADRRSMTERGSLMSPYGGFGQLEMFGIHQALGAYQQMGAEELLGNGKTRRYRKGENLVDQDGSLAFTPRRTQSLVRGIRRSLPGQIAALRGIGGESIPSDIKFNQRRGLLPNLRGREAMSDAEVLRQAIVRATETGREDVPRTASVEEAARMLARGIVHSQIGGVRIQRIPATGGRSLEAMDSLSILDDLTSQHKGRLPGMPSPFPFIGASTGRLGMMHSALRQMVSGERGGFIARAGNQGVPENLQPLIPHIPVGAYSTRQPGDFHGYLGSLTGLGIPGVGSALMSAEIKRRVGMGRISAMTTARERFLHPGDIMEHYRSILPQHIPSLEVSAADSGKGFYASAGFTDAMGFPIGGTHAGRVPGHLELQGPKQLAMLAEIRKQIAILEKEYGLPPGSVKFAKRSSLGSIAASTGVRGKGGDSTVGATSKRGFEPLAAAIDASLGAYINEMMQGLKAGRNGTVGPRQVAKALGKFQEDILGSFGIGSGKGITGMRAGFSALPADSRRRIAKSVSSMFGDLLSDYTERMAPAFKRGGSSIAALGGKSHAEDLRTILTGSQGVLLEELAAVQAAARPSRRRSGSRIPAADASRFRTTPPGSGLEYVNGLPVMGNDIFKSPAILQSLKGGGQGAYNNSLVAALLGQQFMPRLDNNYGSLTMSNILDTHGAFGLAGMNENKNVRGKRHQMPGGENTGLGHVMFDPGSGKNSTVTLFNTVKTMLHEIEHVRERAAELASIKATGGQSSGKAFEAQMKRRGFGSSELLPVYDPGTGELMYVPKGAPGVKVAKEGQLTLPSGAITKSQFMELPIAQRGGFQRATITQAQAAEFDKNAQGSHANIQRHFMPQARMGMESGFGISQMASLLAFSNRNILPGETRDQATLRSRLTNTGFFPGSAEQAVIAAGGINAIRPGLSGTSNPYIAGALPAYEQVAKGPQRTAAMFGARVQAGLVNAVTSLASGGDEMSLLGGAAKALVKATQAIPAKELKATFGSLSSTALADFGMILDAAVGSGRKLTRDVPIGDPVTETPGTANYVDPGYVTDGKGKRRRKANVPAAPVGGGATVRALTPEGLQAVSAALHGLTLSTAGVSASAMPQARANVKQARTGALGLPAQVSPNLEAVRRSLALATIAAEVGAMPEGPHKEALKGMLQPHMPNNPLFDLPKGTRTGRGRSAGVSRPSTSSSTAIIPIGDANLPASDHLARIQASIFGDAFGMGGKPRGPQIPGPRILPEYQGLDDNFKGMSPSLSEVGQRLKGYVTNSRMALGITQEFSSAMERARAGTINFGDGMRKIADSSRGLLFTLKDTIKFATAITLTQNVAGAISQGIGHLTGGFIQFNSILEQSRVGFTTLFKQGGDEMGIAESRAVGMIERMKEFANVTPFRFKQLEEAAIRMKAFGLEMGNIIRRDSSGQLVGYMRSIGDAVAALGGGDEKIMRITYALGQMNSAGRVYQNDMMQLANAGIAGYEILAEKLIQELEAKGENMTAEDKKILNEMYTNRIEAIRKLTSKGAISGKGAVQAIMAGLGERYGGGMERLSKTMAGAFSTIADMSQSLVATMTGPLYDAIRDVVVDLATYMQSDALLETFMKMRDGISGFAQDLRTAIPAAAKVAGDSFGFFIRLIQNMFGSGSGAMNGIDLLKKGFATLADLLSNDVVRSMAMASIAAKVLMSAFTSNPLIATVGAIIALLGVMRGAYEQNFMGIRDTIDTLAPRFQEIADTIQANLVPAIAGFIKGAGTFITGALSTAIKVLGPIIAGLASAFGGIGGVLQVFAPILGFVLAMLITKKLAVDGFAMAFTRLSQAIAGAASQMSVFGANTRYAGTRSKVGSNLGMVAVDEQTGALAGSSLADRAKIGTADGGSAELKNKVGTNVVTPAKLRGASFVSAYGPVAIPGGSVVQDLQTGQVIQREAEMGPVARTFIGATMNTEMFGEKEVQEFGKLRDRSIAKGYLGVDTGREEALRHMSKDEIKELEATEKRTGQPVPTDQLPGYARAAALGEGSMKVEQGGTAFLAKKAREARREEAARRNISARAMDKIVADAVAAGEHRTPERVDAEGNVIDPGGVLKPDYRKLVAPDSGRGAVLSGEERLALIDEYEREGATAEPDKSREDRLREAQEKRADAARERKRIRDARITKEQLRANRFIPIDQFSTEGDGATGVIPGSPRLKGTRRIQEYLKKLGSSMWTLGRRKVTAYDQGQFNTELGIGPTGTMPGSLRVPTQGPIPLGAFNTELSPVGKIRKYLSGLRGARAPISAFSTEGATPGAPLRIRPLERRDLSAFNLENDLMPGRLTRFRENLGERARSIGGGIKDRLTSFATYYKDKHGPAAMQAAAVSASAFATAAGATTMALGGLVGIINADLGATIASVGAGLVGFGQVVSMATAAMAQIGKAKFQNMLSSITGVMMGPVGIIAAIAAVGLALWALDQAVKQSVTDMQTYYKKLVTGDKKASTDIADVAGLRVEKKDNDPTKYRITGMDKDGNLLNSDSSQATIDGMVERGILEMVTNPLLSPGQPGYITYKPTQAGLEAGYSGVTENFDNYDAPTAPIMRTAAEQKAFADSVLNGVMVGSGIEGWDEKKKLLLERFTKGSISLEDYTATQAKAEQDSLEARKKADAAGLTGEERSAFLTTELMGKGYTESQAKKLYGQASSATFADVAREVLAGDSNYTDLERYTDLSKYQTDSGTGFDLSYGKLGKEGLIDESIFNVSENLKLLNDSLDDAQKEAEKASKAFAKLFDPFATVFEQFMARAMKIVGEVFKAEQDQLAAQTSDALSNVTALHNGEVTRLGVLEEQYRVLEEQRKEQERMKALQDAQEAAARATLGLFDAQVDPIDAAIAAREASQALQEEEQNAAMDTLASDIERAKSSVEYAETEEFYAARKKQLDEDQEERQRQITEAAAKLMNDIKLGKITPEKAKAEFFKIFGDVGIDMESILSTGTVAGQSLAATFGTAFVDSFQAFGTTIVDTIGAVVRAGIRAVNAELKIDQIVADIERIESANDKVKGSKIIAEKARLKMVVKDTEFQLRARAADEMDPEKAAAYNELLGQLAKSLTVFDKMQTFDPNKDYTRKQFNDAFDDIYKMFTNLYDITGPLYKIIRTVGTARGGQVGAGRYLVGERGPEMLEMYPGGGGNVIPNHKLPTSMRSSYGALKAGKGNQYQGRANGGPVGPLGGDRNDYGISEAAGNFQDSLRYINDPAGFQQMSFNQFMDSQSKTRVEKNELARRFPKNYAAYVRSKISSGAGGKFGFGRMGGRAAGGPVSASRGMVPTDWTDDPIDDDDDGGTETPSIVCPPGWMPVWNGFGWTCKYFTSTTDPDGPTDPDWPDVVEPEYPPTESCPIGTFPRWDPVTKSWTCVPLDLMWPEFGTPGLPIPRALLLDGRAYMIANNEMPWKMKDGVWTKIKGQLAQAYAPYGRGKGGNPDILDNSGTTNSGKASTKGGPNFGGQQTAVVAGGTGWQKRWGWLSKIPGLGRFKNLSAILQQDVRPLDWLKKNQLGTMVREGMPASKRTKKGIVRRGIDKWIPSGMTGKGILGRIGANGNLMSASAKRIYPAMKWGSGIANAVLSGYEWVESQKMGADYWQEQLNVMAKENAIEEWWATKRKSVVPSWLDPVMGVSNFFANPLGGITDFLGWKDAPRLPDAPNVVGAIGSAIDSSYKMPLVDQAIKNGEIKFPPNIVLDDAQREYFESSKEPFPRFAFRTGGTALGLLLQGAITAFLGVASGGIAIPAALLIGSVLSSIGNAAGGSAYDLLMGTDTPFHEVRGIGNAGDKGLLANMGDVGSGIAGFIDGIAGLLDRNKEKDPKYTEKVSYKEGLFDPQLLAQLSSGQKTQLYGMIEDYRPTDVQLPNPPGGVLNSNAAMLSQGYSNRWYKDIWTNEIPGVREAMHFIQMLPDGFKPFTQSPGRFSPTARAAGGSITPYMPYLVGERGPELMIPSNSGYMLPNTGLKALQAPGDLRAAGGAATINASVIINNPVVSDAANIDKLAEKVSAAQVRTLRAAGFMRPS